MKVLASGLGSAGLDFQNLKCRVKGHEGAAEGLRFRTFVQGCAHCARVYLLITHRARKFRIVIAVCCITLRFVGSHAQEARPRLLPAGFKSPHHADMAEAEDTTNPVPMQGESSEDVPVDMGVEGADNVPELPDTASELEWQMLADEECNDNLPAPE